MNNLCKLCGDKTETTVNIDFKLVFVCQDCCDKITIQNVHWLINHQEAVLSTKGVNSPQTKETLSRDLPESRKGAIVTSSGKPIGKSSGDTIHQQNKELLDKDYAYENEGVKEK